MFYEALKVESSKTLHYEIHYINVFCYLKVFNHLNLIKKLKKCDSF